MLEITLNLLSLGNYLFIYEAFAASNEQCSGALESFERKKFTWDDASVIKLFHEKMKRLTRY